KVGERAFWMRQMIGLVPPSQWTKQFRRSASELIKAAMRGEWGDLVEEAWRIAARRCEDTEWIDAILRWWMFESKAKQVPGNLHTLAKFLPDDRLNALCLQIFERNPQ